MTTEAHDPIIDIIDQRHGLTAVEREVLAGVLTGLDLDGIADTLAVTRSVAKWHLHSLLSNTGAGNREALVRLALSTASRLLSDLRAAPPIGAWAVLDSAQDQETGEWRPDGCCPSEWHHTVAQAEAGARARPEPTCIGLVVAEPGGWSIGEVREVGDVAVAQGDVSTLPITNDLDALLKMRPRLLDMGTGDGRHAFASDAPRYLAVQWHVHGVSEGWVWRTRDGDHRDSGALGSLEELDRLIAWVDERPHQATPC